MSGTPPEKSATTDEISWTDDAIRDLVDLGDLEQSEDDDAPFDPFRESDDETFVFSFRKPTASSTGGDAEDIRIEIRGYKADADAVWKSTGLTVWRAAELLCEHLVENSDLLVPRRRSNGTDRRGGTRVLELGAGLGLCGILAHHLMTDYGSVVVTDGDTDALVALRDNVETNSREATTEGGEEGGTISCRQLLWGREHSEQFLRKYGGGEMFDLLVASDIVYSAVVVAPLWESVSTLMSPDGQFLFGYCSRREVPITIDEVLDAASVAGFAHELVADRDDVLVYLFRWKEERVPEATDDGGLSQDAS